MAHLTGVSVQVTCEGLGALVQVTSPGLTGQAGAENSPWAC